MTTWRQGLLIVIVISCLVKALGFQPQLAFSFTVEHRLFPCMFHIGSINLCCLPFVCLCVCPSVCLSRACTVMPRLIISDLPF